MTDNEIIKALECCSKPYCNDNKCPLHKNTVNTKDCITQLSTNALDLINRQRAEIERYEKTVGKLAINKDGIVTATLNGKETEYIQKGAAEVFKNMAVNRAIKEFAEKMKTILLDASVDEDTGEVKESKIIDMRKAMN